MGCFRVLRWLFGLGFSFLTGLVFFSFLMEVLKIGSLNINGARDPGKRGVLLEYVKQKGLNVLFLQETQ